MPSFWVGILSLPISRLWVVSNHPIPSSHSHLETALVLSTRPADAMDKDYFSLLWKTSERMDAVTLDLYRLLQCLESKLWATLYSSSYLLPGSIVWLLHKCSKIAGSTES